MPNGNNAFGHRDGLTTDERVKVAAVALLEEVMSNQNSFGKSLFDNREECIESAKKLHLVASMLDLLADSFPVYKD